MFVSFKDATQERSEKKVRRQDWIICMESKKKGYKRAAEELKFKAKAATLNRCKNRVKQYR